MNEEPSLLSLPVEVLRLIGDYLSPHELVAMSGVCRYLRSVFNDNSLWQKYSDGGRISQGLDTTVSLVEPKFEISQTTSLEPLCEHRIHFSKQSRLLNNLRQGRFVEQSIEFSASIFPSKELKNKKKTYGNKFLFTKDQADNRESIMIFDIENSPSLLLSVNIEPRLDVCEIMWLQVAGDRLVVRRENWFTVYEIKLPIESIDVLYSINVNLHRDDIGEQFIIGKYLFVDDNEYNVVHVWDLTDGNQCNDIHPKISCDAFTMINYSQNEELVLFLGGCTIEDSSDPYACVYDINLKDFSSFNPTISAKDFKRVDIDGDLDSNHVVFLVRGSNLESRTCSVLVFDYNNSTLVAKRSDLHAHGPNDISPRIVSGYLVVPSKVGVSVMDLKSLQIVWEVQLDMPEQGMLEVEWVDVLYIASLTCVIVVHKETGVEMWDFNTRRKVLDMPEGFSTLNDTCSKLISYASNRITVRSFW